MFRERYTFGEFELLVMQVLLSTYGTFNYLLCRDGKAVLIDAGEAEPIFEGLESENLQLLNVLITHQHPDHAGGCRAIQDRLGVQSTSPGVQSGEFPMLGTLCRSFATPGHLAVCKSYYFPEQGILFTGDTIIGGGVGRLMGGTAEQFFQSLEFIKQLPDETVVFGGHDYLEDHMKFAMAVDSGNAAAKERLERYRSDPYSAVFATLGEEKKSNPFLQVDCSDDFAELRRRKDLF